MAAPGKPRQKECYNKDMKKIETVIEHLIADPTYSRLRAHTCFGRIKKALPDPLRRGILFMYVKNDTLFFALKHPAFKMEFDYKLPTVKKLLSTLPPLQEACGGYGIRRIKTFVSRFAASPNPTRDTEPRYKEAATSGFAVHTSDPVFHKTFEAIKRSIDENRG